MTSSHITVFYKWTAKSGNPDELKAVYEQVQLGAEFGKHAFGSDR